MEHCERCNCTQDRYLAGRLDIYKAAQAVALGVRLPADSEPLDVSDIMNIALFLAGALGGDGPQYREENEDYETDPGEEQAAT